MKHLAIEIQKAVRENRVIVNKHPNADLWIYNYSPICQYDRLWDEITYLHRKYKSYRKLPDQDNYIVECSCGCGTKFLKFDEYNRLRQYIKGHNPPERETINLILKEINNGVITSKNLYKSINKSKNAIKVALSKMAKLNMIVRIKIGYYGPLGTPPRQNPIIECCCGCKKKFNKFDKTWRERKYISGHNMR